MHKLRAWSAWSSYKVSLPWSLIISSDEKLLFDEDSATLLIAALCRLSDHKTEIILAYGRNRNAEEPFFSQCQGIFDVSRVRYEDLHPTYRTLDTDVQVLRLCRSEGNATLGRSGFAQVPISPHLRANSAPSSVSVDDTRSETVYHFLQFPKKKTAQALQYTKFCQMPRRCRYLWWKRYQILCTGRLKKTRAATFAAKRLTWIERVQSLLN